MARPSKTIPTAADDGFSAERLEEAGETAIQMATLQRGYDQGRDLVNQLLGQAQMADAFAQFSKTVFTSKLAYVKENKLYRALAGKGTEDGLQLSGTWEEFCGLMKVTPQHANESIENLKSLGCEALESMSRMGIGYREMRQYRQLPEDQKQALIEVAKSGDKESFVELAEEIIAKHAKEKESFAQQLQSKDEVVASKQKLVDYQADQIDALNKKASFVATASPSERLEGIRTELLAHAAGIEGALAGKLAPCFAALKEHLAEHGGECDAYLSSTLGQIERAVREIRESFGLLRAEDVAPWANAG